MADYQRTNQRDPILGLLIDSMLSAQRAQQMDGSGGLLSSPGGLGFGYIGQNMADQNQSGSGTDPLTSMILEWIKNTQQAQRVDGGLLSP